MPATECAHSNMSGAAHAGGAVRLSLLVVVAAVIVLSVRLFGKTGGNIDVETGDWTWPVDVCQGCLLACGGDGTTSSVQCHNFQDSVVVFGAAHPNFEALCMR